MSVIDTRNMAKASSAAIEELFRQASKDGEYNTVNNFLEYYAVSVNCRDAVRRVESFLCAGFAVPRYG